MKKQSIVRPRLGTWRRESQEPPLCSDPKRKGEMAELAFLCKAAGMGFGVAKPYGDSERFDFIVSSGRRLWRVQVKSTYKADKRGYHVHAYSGGKKSCLEIYSADDVDWIVAYLVSENAWYVIPIKAVDGRNTLYFYPNGSRRASCRYEKYREAWWLMKAKRKVDVAKRPG